MTGFGWQVSALALSPGTAGEPGARQALTAREREAIAYVAEGHTAASAAAAMGISARTIDKHLENAYRKLGVSNSRAAAAALRRTLGEGDA